MEVSLSIKSTDPTRLKRLLAILEYVVFHGNEVEIPGRIVASDVPLEVHEKLAINEILVAMRNELESK